MTGFLPKSRKARRRLMVVAVAAPILAGATGLAMYALGDSVSFFYSPAQAKAAHVPAGRSIELGGLVENGSLIKASDGNVGFTITDRRADSRVVYKGDLPDLFREGQGVVTKGHYREDGVFVATEVLAKHDEKYMPREVSQALKASGEWRGGPGASGGPAGAGVAK